MPRELIEFGVSELAVAMTPKSFDSPSTQVIKTHRGRPLFWSNYFSLKMRDLT